MEEQLGQAKLILTADTSLLLTKLREARAAVEGLKVEPIKLQVDGGSTNSFGSIQTALKNVSNEAERAKVRVQSLLFVLETGPSPSSAGLSAQISRLVTESRALKITSSEYLTVLTRISELENVRANRVGRQRVNADFQAFNGPTLGRGYGAPANLPSLPKTFAADRQILAELTEKLNNLIAGTVRYELTARQLEATQTRLNAALRAAPTADLTGFGAASARNFGTSDPVQKSIRRNDDKVAAEAEREGKAREESLRITEDLLNADLARQRVLNEIAQRIRESAAASADGFGKASASNFGTQDPVQKSIRRNNEKVAEADDRQSAQRDALDADLQRVKEQRIQAEQALLKADQLALQRKRRLEAFDAKLEKANADRGAAARKRIGDGISSGLIGGAFPALFGQGLGASAGGGIGGLIGGLAGNGLGFGLSLIGTSLGQTLDNLTEALKSPIDNFQMLKDAAIISSLGLEKNIEGLIATGRVSEANAAIQLDLVSRFGAGGLTAVQNLGTATDELARSWADLTTAFAIFLAGPLKAVIDEIKRAADQLGTAVTFQNLKNQLNPEQDAQVQKVTDKATLDAQKSRLSKDPNYRPGLFEMPPNEGDVLVGRQAGIELMIKLLKLKEQEAKLEAEIAAAVAQTNAERSNSYRLQTAQIQGNRTAQFDAQEKTIIDKRNQELRKLKTQGITSPTDARVQQANADAAFALNGIEERRLQLQKEIVRTINEEILKREQIKQQMAVIRAQTNASLAKGDAAANPGNSYLASRAGTAEGDSFRAQNEGRIQDALRQQQALRNQLSQESDPTKQAQLAEQIKSAALETKKAFAEAGASLAEKVATAVGSLRSARDSLRSTLEGNLNKIPLEQKRQLLNDARADVERGRESGILRPDIGAGGTRKTLELAGFVREVERQRAAIAQQEALIEALKANTEAERNIQITVTRGSDGSYNVGDREGALL